MSLRKRVESGQINREVFECWCDFKGYTTKTVFCEEELYSRWCHCLFASMAILFVTAIISTWLFHLFNLALWMVIMVCISCALMGAVSLYCFAMVAYHYDPERIYDEDWGGLTGTLDSRPDLEDGPRSLAKQIRVRLQYLENEEIRIQSEYFKLYGKSESSPKNGGELTPLFERRLYEIRWLQAALVMFTEGVHKIS